jgi:hypothetical protein
MRDRGLQVALQLNSFVGVIVDTRDSSKESPWPTKSAKSRWAQASTSLCLRGGVYAVGRRCTRRGGRSVFHRPIPDVHDVSHAKPDAGNELYKQHIRYPKLKRNLRQ